MQERTKNHSANEFEVEKLVTLGQETRKTAEHIPSFFHYDSTYGVSLRSCPVFTFHARVLRQR